MAEDDAVETEHITSDPAGPRSPMPVAGQPHSLRRSVIALLVLLAVSLLILPLVANLLATTASSQDAYAGITRVELDLGAPGDVEIGGTSDDRVVVERTVRSFLGITTTVDQQQTGTTLRLRTRCQLRILVTPGCGAAYTLRVPTDTVMVGSASNGSLDVAGVDGEIDLSTSNGSVTVEGGESSMTLRSSNGRIDVSGTRSARVDLRTSNGNISLISDSAPDAVSVRTSNGRIDIVVPDDAPAYAVEARTSNGLTDIAIATDPSASFTIGARTSNGDISVRNPS